MMLAAYLEKLETLGFETFEAIPSINEWTEIVTKIADAFDEDGGPEVHEIQELRAEYST